MKHETIVQMNVLEYCKRSSPNIAMSFKHDNVFTLVNTIHRLTLSLIHALFDSTAADDFWKQKKQKLLIMFSPLFKNYAFIYKDIQHFNRDVNWIQAIRKTNLATVLFYLSTYTSRTRLHVKGRWVCNLGKCKYIKTQNR